MSGQDPRRCALADLDSLIGEDLGHTPWREVTQARIDQFAAATDDHQWIHTDPERARSGPFGTTIAHGFLTLSLVSAALEELLVVPDAAMAVNYGLDRARFPAPVPSGSRNRIGGRISSVSPSGPRRQAVLSITAEIEGGAKPACVADLVVLFVAADGTAG